MHPRSHSPNDDKTRSLGARISSLAAWINGHAGTGTADVRPTKPAWNETRVGRFKALAAPSRAPRGYSQLLDSDDPPSINDVLPNNDFSTASSSVTSATTLEFWRPWDDAPEEIPPVDGLRCPGSAECSQKDTTATTRPAYETTDLLLPPRQASERLCIQNGTTNAEHPISPWKKNPELSASNARKSELLPISNTDQAIRSPSRDGILDAKEPVDLDNPLIDKDDETSNDGSWSGVFSIDEDENGELFRGLMGYAKGFEPRTIYRLRDRSKRSPDTSLVVRRVSKYGAGSLPSPKTKRSELSQPRGNAVQSKQRQVKFDLDRVMPITQAKQ